MRGMILTQGTPDQCVRAYPVDTFEEQAAHFLADPVTTRQGRVSRRAFFSGAYPSELDRQGRVLIPPVLRQFAELGSQVSVVGTGEALEIWSTSTFEAALAAEDEEFRQAMDSE